MSYHIDNCRCKEIKVGGIVIAIRVTPYRNYYLSEVSFDEEGKKILSQIRGYIQIPVDKFDDYITNIEVIEIEEKEGE